MSDTTEVEQLVAKFKGWIDGLTDGERAILDAVITVAAGSEVEGYRLDQFKDVGGNPATQRPSGLGAGGEFALGGGPGGGLQQVVNQVAVAVSIPSASFSDWLQGLGS